MKLAAIGSNCIDYYNNINGGKAFAGGGPVNMAVYTVRIGGEASYIGPVGKDSYGQFMIDAIRDKGVNVSHLYQRDGKTAVSQVQLVNGERVFGDYDEGVLSDYDLSDDDISFILQHDLVVADLWGKVENRFRDLKSKGIKTAFDCADRPDDEAAQIAMPYTDYLFFSSEDGVTEEIKSKMKHYHDIGPKLVICMLGSDGSLCYDGEKFTKYGIKKCEHVVDTMGAGDSYVAGFLTGIVDNFDLIKAMELGAATATDTLEYFGAW